MLAEERLRLLQVPDLPHTAALGVTRRVPDNTPMVTFEHCQYSVPSTLLGQSVWVRHHDGTDEIVVCALDDGGPIEVARHRRTSPGTPAIDDAHFPGHHHKVPGDYRVHASLPPSTRSSRSAPVPRCGSRRRPRPAPNGSTRRWPMPSSCPSWAPAVMSTGHSGTPRCTAASPPGSRGDPADQRDGHHPPPRPRTSLPGPGHQRMEHAGHQHD
jgi:hypothetical protein